MVGITLCLLTTLNRLLEFYAIMCLFDFNWIFCYSKKVKAPGGTGALENICFHAKENITSYF